MAKPIVETPEDRLRRMVAMWRERPAVELAEAIVAAGALLDRKRAKLAGKDKDQRLRNWLALDAAGHDDALTGWMLAHSFVGDLYRYQEPCMKRIARWQPDPRITNALVAQLGSTDGYISLDSWRPLVTALSKSKDVRALPVLDAHHDKRCTKIAAAIRAALPRGAPKSNAAARALLAGAAPPRDETSLLAAVWATPHDDGPRLVYADYLQELGDPRGEFIVLQCVKTLDVAGRKRMRELQRKHAHDWFGPLAPAILETNPVAFERGFLSKCVVCAHWGLGPNDDSTEREQQIRRLFDHPAWSTLREVKMAKLGRKKRAPLIAHLERLGVRVTVR